MLDFTNTRNMRVFIDHVHRTYYPDVDPVIKIVELVEKEIGKYGLLSVAEFKDILSKWWLLDSPINFVDYKQYWDSSDGFMIKHTIEGYHLSVPWEKLIKES